MDTQKEVLIKMLIPKTDDVRSKSLTPAESQDSTDKPAAAVFLEKETEITVFQVGNLTTPKFRQSTLDKPIGKLFFERGPILNLKSIFYMAASLMKLEEVQFYFTQSHPRVLNGLMSFHSLIAQKFISSSVKRLYMYVNLPMFQNLDEENRRNLTELITSILDVSPKCFPNLNKIGLELPDDGHLEIYKSLCQLIKRVPVLGKAKITTEIDEKRISSYYPFDLSCVQLSLENCNRLYNSKIAKQMVPSASPALNSPPTPQLVQITKQEPRSPSCSPPNGIALPSSGTGTLNSTTTAATAADESLLADTLKNPEYDPVPEKISKSVSTKAANVQIQKSEAFQAQNSTSLSSNTAQRSDIVTPEVPNIIHSESRKPCILLKSNVQTNSVPSKSVETSKALSVSRGTDVPKQTEPSSSSKTKSTGGLAETSASTATTSRTDSSKNLPSRSYWKPSYTREHESPYERPVSNRGSARSRAQPRSRSSRNRTRGGPDTHNRDPYSTNHVQNARHARNVHQRMDHDRSYGGFERPEADARYSRNGSNNYEHTGYSRTPTRHRHQHQNQDGVQHGFQRFYNS